MFVIYNAAVIANGRSPAMACTGHSSSGASVSHRPDPHPNLHHHFVIREPVIDRKEAVRDDLIIRHFVCLNDEEGVDRAGAIGMEPVRRE